MTLRLRTPMLVGLSTVALAVGGLVVPPASAATTTVAQDSFARTVSGGWGTAEVGGAWTTSGSSTSVSNGQGRFSLSSGASGWARSGQTASGTVDVAVDLAADKVATGGGQYYSVIVRGTLANGYRATARVQSNGSLVLQLRRTINGSDTTLSSTTLPSMVPSAGSKVRVRVTASGAAPVTLQARAWKVGTSEPTAWQVSATDSNSTAGTNGPVAVAGYLSTTTTNAPVAFTFDNLVATGTTTTTTTPPPTTISTKPAAANTGVPDGLTLKVLSASNKPYAGDSFSADGTVYTIKTPNAVYDGWRFDSFVEVRAPGVKITRSNLRGGASTSSDRGLLFVSPDATTVGQPSAVIEDSTLIPRAPSYRIDGIRGSNFTARRVEITGVVDGLHIHGTSTRTDTKAGNVTLEASWIHDLTFYSYDPRQSDGSHNDAIQVIGGRNIKIQGNTFNGKIRNAALQVTQNRNNVSSLTYTGNWADGGACTVNVAHRPYAAISGLTVSSNKFGRNSEFGCPMIIQTETANIASISGNVWEDGKTPLPTVVKS